MILDFTNWAYNRPDQGKFQPEDTASDLCTHIVYCFAVLNKDTLLMKQQDSFVDSDLGKRIFSLIKNEISKLWLFFQVFTNVWQTLKRPIKRSSWALAVGMILKVKSIPDWCLIQHQEQSSLLIPYSFSSKTILMVLISIGNIQNVGR